MLKILNMNIEKKIWMFWGGAEIPKLNKICIERWRALNREFKFTLLNDESLYQYLPEFYEIDRICRFERNYQAKTDLIRLMLLDKFGGIWCDASLYPDKPLCEFIDQILNEKNFFAYSFPKRSNGRDVASFFLVAKQGSYIIKEWMEEFKKDYIFGPKDFNSGKDKNNNFDPSNYFFLHKALSRLYDSNNKIKNILDNMVKVNVELPNSASWDWGKKWDDRMNHYMYKRPSFMNPHQV